MSEVANRRPDIRGFVPALDGLRGTAVLGIVFLHVWRPETETWLGRVLSKAVLGGWIGVDLFFVLSGFLITGILVDARGGQRFLRFFYVRRLLRIVPLYWLFLAVCFLVMPHFVASVGFERIEGFRFAAAAEDWPWYVLIAPNLLMASRDSFSQAFPLDVTWSLGIEEQFYLVWPMLVALVSTHTLRRCLWAFVLLAPLCRLGLVLGFENPWLRIFVLLPTRVDTLAAGGLIALAVRAPTWRADRWAKLRRLGLFGGLGGVELWILIQSFRGVDVRQQAVFQVVGYSLVVLAGVGVLIAALDGRGFWWRLFSTRAALSLGRYSYGIYLAHLLLLSIAMPVGYRPVLELLGHPLLERFFWLIVLTTTTWGVSAVVFHAYEQPFLRLKRFFPRTDRARTVHPT